MPALAHTDESGETDDVNYTMFVHEDCPHCQLVEAFVEQNGIEDHITYLELKNNDENMDLLEQKWEELEIPGGIGWPMMIVDEEAKLYETGDTPIISYLAEEFGLDYDPATDTNVGAGGGPNQDTSGGDTLFFMFGAIIVLGVVGYAISSVVSEKK